MVFIEIYPMERVKPRAIFTPFIRESIRYIGESPSIPHSESLQVPCVFRQLELFWFPVFSIETERAWMVSRQAKSESPFPLYSNLTERVYSIFRRSLLILTRTTSFFDLGRRERGFYSEIRIPPSPMCVSTTRPWRKS